jgi:hypothetical protein
MHNEIISPRQSDLIPYLKDFKTSFYLAGGTAIAMHIGHRQSIDFDLITTSRIDKSRIKAKLKEIPFEQKPLFEDYDQLHFLINGVRVTFLNYPYSIEHPVKFNSFITMPTLLTLAAMKAFALGRRAKWKYYVDLFFILRDYYSIKEIANQTSKIFGQLFSEKLFREQLAFHKDIDYTEPVAFVVKPVPDDEIKNFLIEKAINLFD